MERSWESEAGSYTHLDGYKRQGENDDVVRKMVCDKLAPFGVKLDEEKNATRSKGPRIISTPDSSGIIAVIPTNE